MSLGLKNFFLGFADGSVKVQSDEIATSATVPANPMTAVGDLLYGGTVSGGYATPTRLAGNTAATFQFLVSTGSGSAATAPTLTALGPQHTTGLYVAGGGAKNAYTGTLSPAPAAYATGMLVIFKSGATTNDAASTINLNSLGAKAIVTKANVALSGGEIVNGTVYVLVYDGTSFRLLV